MQETSLEAYRSIKPLGRRQQQVLSYITDNPECCNLDIAVGLDLPINSVTGRVKELAESARIYPYGHKTSKTGRRAITWRIKPLTANNDLFPENQRTSKEYAY